MKIIRLNRETLLEHLKSNSNKKEASFLMIERPCTLYKTPLHSSLPLIFQETMLQRIFLPWRKHERDNSTSFSMKFLLGYFCHGENMSVTTAHPSP